jgi:hypothetical protein
MGQDVVIVGRNELPKNGSNFAYSKMAVNSDGHINADTYWQDQTTDVVIANFNKVTNNTTLNGAVAIDDRTIVVTSATGIAVGSYIILFDSGGERFSTFYATVVVGTTITLDSPLDYAYPDGTFVDVAITDLSVNGAVTPQVFGLRGIGAPPGVDINFHVTRIIFEMITDAIVDLSKFGDQAPLTNGLLLRTRNTRYKNIFNVKTNAEIAGIMYDWNPFAKLNPVQGVDGFVARLTFGGPSKIGVVIDLPIGDDLEVHVQDDLSGITSFKMWAEGHITEE